MLRNKVDDNQKRSYLSCSCCTTYSNYYRVHAIFATVNSTFAVPMFGSIRIHRTVRTFASLGNGYITVHFHFRHERGTHGVLLNGCCLKDESFLEFFWKRGQNFLLRNFNTDNLFFSCTFLLVLFFYYQYWLSVSLVLLLSSFLFTYISICNYALVSSFLGLLVFCWCAPGFGDDTRVTHQINSHGISWFLLQFPCVLLPEKQSTLQSHIPWTRTCTSHGILK